MITDDQDKFTTMFWGVLDEAQLVYEAHKEKKGDSWQTLPIDKLRGLVAKEFAEWVKAATAGRGMAEYKETIDLILVTMMLADRLSVDHGGRI